MPKFKITYEVDAADYYEAETIAGDLKLKGCDFGISKVRGPNLNKGWYVVFNGEAIDFHQTTNPTMYSTKTKAQEDIDFVIKEGFRSWPRIKSAYKIVRAPNA